jgi:spermidine synthase
MATPYREIIVIPWKELDWAEPPGNEGKITLRQRGSEFSIRTADTELMNSRLHGSEDALAELTYSRLKQKEGLRVLIGGLGMGYTLAAALKQSQKDTLISVAELIPAVVRWNRQHLGHLAGEPLDDPRVSIQEEDVAKAISRKKSTWDAILLDVDNGPDGLTQKANDRLYSISGLKTSFAALRPGGILAVWSSGPDEAFTCRLKRCQYQTETLTVRAHKPGKGARHTIWLARKP